MQYFSKLTLAILRTPCVGGVSKNNLSINLKDYQWIRQFALIGFWNFFFSTNVSPCQVGMNTSRLSSSSSSSKDLISPEGLRQDGRKYNEIRQLQIQFGNIPDANGSAFFQLGNTKVVALVFGPHEPTDRSNQGYINFDLSIASFALPHSKVSRSSSARRLITSSGGKRTERKSTEICSFLQSTFNLMLHESIDFQGKGTQIDVLIEVLQSDGSLLSACLNVTSAALIDAGIPMRDFVCSCSIGYSPSSQSLLLVDPNGEEEGQFRISSFTCALLPRTGEIVSCTLSTGRLLFERMNEALKLATAGISQIHSQMDKILYGRLRELVTKRTCLSSSVK